MQVDVPGQAGPPPSKPEAPSKPVRKMAYPVQVRVDSEGRMLCPHCADPLIEVEPGKWCCPDTAQLDEYIRRDLQRILGEGDR